MLKLLRKLMTNFAIISLFLIASCKDYQNINFNPDFYIGSYEEQAIKNEYGKIVYANEIKFNEFSCFSLMPLSNQCLNHINLSQCLEQSRVYPLNKSLSRLCHCCNRGLSP